MPSHSILFALPISPTTPPPPHLVNRAATETKGIEKHRFDSSRPTLSPIRDYWKESVFYAALFSLFFFLLFMGDWIADGERGKRQQWF